MAKSAKNERLLLGVVIAAALTAVQTGSDKQTDTVNSIATPECR